MMKVMDYDQELHKRVVMRWLESRGHAKDSVDRVPAIGFVAYCDTTPVAVGFLRSCEGIGMLEGLATNPATSSSQRHLGIEEVVVRIIAKAKELGFPQILAYSIDDGVIHRGGTHGFKILPHKLLGLNL